MATILSPDGRQQEVQPANGTDFQLNELQQIVGGSIELVQTIDGRIMVINDEGRLLSLPRNTEATRLVHFPSASDLNALKTVYAKRGVDVLIIGDPDEDNYIAGTALVCNEDEVR